MDTIYSYSVNTINGETISLDRYKGQLLLIINTASRCGFTPQYAGLENLYQTYRNQGFTVLGFPCNQFGQQEPGTSQEIAGFCDTHYGISFPLFEKIQVNGQSAHPLFNYLKSAAPGVLGTQSIKWNFTKFLVDRNGAVIKRYPSMTSPNMLQKDIKNYL
ncbi:MAG: glutathione peroxidase [Methylomonas sp.]|nr:MAG: glutathione peroxidase [Methylomonas sp.]